MLNPQQIAAPALVSPGWVEARLGIGRAKRINLEAQGILTPVRLTKKSHRRYERSAVEAVAEGDVPQ